jgi:hypothetical protein
MGKKKKAKAKAKAKAREQAVKNVLRQAQEFGEKAREVVGRVIGDKASDREVISDQTKSSVKEAAQLVKEAALLVKEAALIVKDAAVKAKGTMKHDPE